MNPSQINDRIEALFATKEPVCFVTGSAAARVGQAIARGLRELGFRVVWHAHRDDSRFSSSNDLLLVGPVEQEANIQRWHDQILERYGRIDVVVNSAAVWGRKSLDETTAADYRREFEVNALGTALMCKEFGLQMVKQAQGGCIVNIGDWAVARPYCDFSAYFPSKGAVETITRSMAVELATRNPKVRVSAVLPGPVLLSPEISEDRRQNIIDASLLKREGTPADVSHAVNFLVTSPFITGVCLPVDGGRTIYAGPSSDTIAHPEFNR